MEVIGALVFVLSVFAAFVLRFEQLRAEDEALAEDGRLERAA